MPRRTRTSTRARFSPGPIANLRSRRIKAIEAYRIARLAEDHSEIPCYLITTKLDLVSEPDQLIRDISDQIGKTAPVAIVIDTLSLFAAADIHFGIVLFTLSVLMSTYAIQRLARSATSTSRHG